jgi:hypothetical protein
VRRKRDEQTGETRRTVKSHSCLAIVGTITNDLHARLTLGGIVGSGGDGHDGRSGRVGDEGGGGVETGDESGEGEHGW